MRKDCQNKDQLAQRKSICYALLGRPIVPARRRVSNRCYRLSQVRFNAVYGALGSSSAEIHMYMLHVHSLN